MSLVSETLSPKIVIQASKTDQRRKPKLFQGRKKVQKFYGLEVVASGLIRAPIGLRASPGYSHFGAHYLSLPAWLSGEGLQHT